MGIVAKVVVIGQLESGVRDALVLDPKDKADNSNSYRTFTRGGKDDAAIERECAR